MIIRGGENTFSARSRTCDILIRGHGSAIVGIPDATGARCSSPSFVPPGEVAEQELTEFCRQRLAPYKTPRHWRFVDQFPQTASSKVQKYVFANFTSQRRSLDALGMNVGLNFCHVIEIFA